MAPGWAKDEKLCGPEVPARDTLVNGGIGLIGHLRHLELLRFTLDMRRFVGQSFL